MLRRYVRLQVRRCNLEKLSRLRANFTTSVITSSVPPVDSTKTKTSQNVLRWETVEPTSDQLARAQKFFTSSSPSFLWSANQFSKMAESSAPEVVFLGRSNVGKSSVLNSLLASKSLARTSSKPGRTRLMNAFKAADGKITLLDVPGYGHASHSEWGDEIIQYLRFRRLLRRSYLLIDAEHGIKKSDEQVLEVLRDSGQPVQIVLSKADKVKQSDAELMHRIKDLIQGEYRSFGIVGEVIITSASPKKPGLAMRGLNDLRWSIMNSCGYT